LNLNKFVNNYLKPKSFEVFGKDSIYTYLGIKFFKKYLPTSGDKIRKIYGIKQIHFKQSDKFSELYKYELKTRRYELRHIIGMLVFIILLFIINKEYSLFDTVFVSSLFLIVNVYPIMLQRHNRIRIIRILKNHSQPSPYDSDFKIQ